MNADQPDLGKTLKRQARSALVRKASRASIREILALSRIECQEWSGNLTREQKNRLFRHWRFWARPNQVIPPGDWVYWLILAGRGAGKTRAGAEAVRQWINTFPYVNLIGATTDDARDVMVLGESGILACCPQDERPVYSRRSARLVWPNGATSQVFSAEEPDRLRGKQHMKLWCDELAAWRHPETFEQALLGLRLGGHPQAVITTTPRPIKILKQLLDDKNAIVTRGTTFDNADHLARVFLDRIAARYEGRAIGRQELFAEILEETPGALWTRDLIERCRIAASAAPGDYAQIVVAVDPPATSGARADECGIIVAAKAANGEIYVLADLTSQGESPGGWASRVVAAYRNFSANRVVAEVNNGGEMVADVLRQCEANLPVRSVTATRGKFLRAEPVAAAYERGMVHHVGIFEKLEDQLCALTADFDARSAGFSPDRADALVWAIADLINLDGKGRAGMVEYYRDAARKR
ncbi:DNA-packaging protein [Methylocapsa sp. S129]|uniref:DNA-packaging protein n=1 Tax=Methylocapsa sp. S129 TaxID=1641869 RepID=UPI00131BB5E6|nr:terminase family protein [Methylocapsa sp. S129]